MSKVMIFSKPASALTRTAADDAAGRAGQDRVLALEQLRVDQAAARLHEHQPHVAERVRHPVDVAPQDRREVGVDHGGVAAADQLHQRRDLDG